jgi:hypothetical protein
MSVAARSVRLKYARSAQTAGHDILKNAQNILNITNNVTEKYNQQLPPCQPAAGGYTVASEQGEITGRSVQEVGYHAR